MEINYVVSKHLFVNEDLTGWWVICRAIHHITKMKTVQLIKLTPKNQKVYMDNNTYGDVMGVEIYQVNIEETLFY